MTVFCVPYQSVLMPRRGWRAVEVPEGWLKVIRGPRPASAQWPRAAQNLNRENRGKKVPKEDLDQGSVPPRPARPARSPDVVSAEDCRGSSTVGERRVRKGGGQPTRETVGFGIKGCKIEVGGTNRRKVGFLPAVSGTSPEACVTSAESAISEAVAEKDRFVAELAEGEKRMERLREEARAAPPPRDLVGEEFHYDVAQMRQEILELRRFRDRFLASALRGAEGPLVLVSLPAMPENPHQLETWMSDRNADLRSALASKTDPTIISQLADMLSKGATKLF